MVVSLLAAVRCVSCKKVGQSPDAALAGMSRCTTPPTTPDNVIAKSNSTTSNLMMRHFGLSRVAVSRSNAVFCGKTGIT
jgi:hypothetical protein